MKTLFVAGPAPTAPGGMAYSTASGTIYLCIAGQFSPYRFGYLPPATEGSWRTTVDADGNLADLEVYISANTRTTATTFTLMKNGAATGYSISVPAGATGWRSATGGPVALVVNDLLSLRMQTGTGGGSITLDMVESTFLAGDGTTVAHYMIGGDYGFAQGVDTTSRSLNPSSLSEDNGFGTGWGTSAGYVTWAARAKLDSTAISLRVDVPTNSTAVATELELYVNNVASGLKIIIGAGVTGRLRATGAINIVPGDLLDVRRVNPVFGSGTLIIGNIQTGIRFDGNGFEVWSAVRSNSSVQGYAAATFRQSAPNPYIGPDSANPWTRAKFYAGTADRLWILAVISSPGTGNWPVCELRVNGATSALAITVPTAVGGNFHLVDTVHSVTLVDGDNAYLAFRTLEFAQSPRAWGFVISADLPPPSDIEVFPVAGQLVVAGVAPLLETEVALDVPVGQLVIEGFAPEIPTAWIIRPPAGELVLEGVAPDIFGSLEVAPIAGELVLEGFAPGVLIGTSILPSAGELIVEGGFPFISTRRAVFASQLAAIGLVEPETPEAQVSQVAAIAIGEPPPPPTRVSQSAAVLLGLIVPEVQVSQAAVIIFGVADPCVTQRCQIWRIVRRDGRVFCFTSHDRPVTYGLEVYSPCSSLDPSASENASTLGSTGNIELTGIIDSDAITEADLYGGLFDDAFVTVDLISWGEVPEAPRRLAAGWTGSLSHGEEGFKMEVLGPGSRLDQQALVQMVTPGCRWTFGDARCGVDADALGSTGKVTVPAARGRFLALLDGAPGSSQWENGLVRWTSGPNAGQSCEVKTVDWSTGEVVLWSSPAFLPEPGDNFFVRPGCDKDKVGGCTVYANVINHGGFADVPGTDSLLETPDAKI